MDYGPWTIDRNRAVTGQNAKCTHLKNRYPEFERVFGYTKRFSLLLQVLKLLKTAKMVQKRTIGDPRMFFMHNGCAILFCVIGCI